MNIFPPKRVLVPGHVSSSEVGSRTEAFIVSRLMENGYVVLAPFGVQRYDLAFEDAERRFWRIQCKTGRWVKGSILFNARNSQFSRGNGGWKNNQRPYKGDCDYFAVYSRDTGKAYLVPVNEVGVSVCSLRVEPTGNNAEKGIRWAADYEL